MKEDSINEIINDVTKQLADEGKIIEAGWRMLRTMAIPANASEIQISESRKMFFAGAQHLFGSIFSMFDPGVEETDADVSRIEKISVELADFAREFLRGETQ